MELHCKIALHRHNYTELRAHMAPKCEMFMNVVKTSLAFANKKYDCQTQNTRGITDVKEQIWVPTVKYLSLST